MKFNFQERERSQQLSRPSQSQNTTLNDEQVQMDRLVIVLKKYSGDPSTEHRKSRYSNHLNTRQFWYSNGPNVSGCQMVWIWNRGLKNGQKMYVLWSKM